MLQFCVRRDFGSISDGRRDSNERRCFSFIKCSAVRSTYCISCNMWKRERSDSDYNSTVWFQRSIFLDCYTGNRVTGIDRMDRWNGRRCVISGSGLYGTFSVAAKCGAEVYQSVQCVFDFEPGIGIWSFVWGVFFPEILNLRLITGFVLIFVAIVISETELSFLKGKKKRCETRQTNSNQREIC